jgi:hypothetical protein
MKPMQVFEDGMLGTRLGFPLGRRRFVRWGEMRGLSMVPAGQGTSRLLVEYGRKGRLVSVPGEFPQRALKSIEARRAAANPERREEDAAKKSLALAREEVSAVGRAGIDTKDFELLVEQAARLLEERRFLDGATRALSARAKAAAAARAKVDAAIAQRSMELARERAEGRNTDEGEAELSRARRLMRGEGTDWAAALEAATRAGRRT